MKSKYCNQLKKEKKESTQFFIDNNEYLYEYYKSFLKFKFKYY